MARWRAGLRVSLVLALLTIAALAGNVEPALAGGGQPDVAPSLLPSTLTVNSGNTFTMTAHLTLVTGSHAVSIVSLQTATRENPSYSPPVTPTSTATPFSGTNPTGTEATGFTVTNQITPTPTAAPGGNTILVFYGNGVTSGDYNALTKILTNHGYGYDTVNSPQLENMTLTQLSKYKLIVWPGGDSLVQNSNLDKATKQRVHDAVVKNGVSYVGFCAGTFIAVAPSQPAQGGWGLGIVTAAYVPVYPAVPNPSESTAAMVWTTYANGTKRDLVWWDGPVAPNLSNGIISKYPSGQPEMAESWEGNGFVVLSGTHPEAPQGWRTEKNLTDPDGLDLPYAWQLIQAAYTRTPLPHF